MSLHCAIEGCTNDPPRLIKGVCPMHDARMRAWGHYGSPTRQRTPNRECVVEGCLRRHSAGGYCKTHASRVRAHGDPLAGIPVESTRRRLTAAQPCSVDGCLAKHWARGYCRKHYKRWHANGSPDLKTFEQKFWEQVVRGAEDECWIWTGATARGYGHGNTSAGHFYAHRQSYEWAHGVTLDPKTVVRHHCDNPPCVNPAHLAAGTQLDNMRDMVARGRGRWQRRAAS